MRQEDHPDHHGPHDGPENDVPDLIWQRAVDAWVSGPGSGPGDVALADVLSVHGPVMNGGLLHAVTDACSAEEVDAAERGFRWLGLDGAAEALAETRRAARAAGADPAALEVQADAAYHRAVPDDAALEQALRARYAASPESFAPVDEEAPGRSRRLRRLFRRRG
ncbi:hypothetical protein GGQ22_07735 [Nocardioides sp. zg-579]|uniref:DUF4375 domain-containing protein n=1 Tax=Nocardioides marmotae TaxID=2663857 RepID=A0A6I3J680_9ACTN|nr:hypothetical protein [Nocardioides marmotae]MCR6031335.1 hypothetical protein [Gordonia jinghuaiqii]MTB94974.1 hypothetical protein [Nocardioides marmotae]QKE02519.1 hypothetical protein HPC71_16675 [Nocardioides marmotae]